MLFVHDRHAQHDDTGTVCEAAYGGYVWRLRRGVSSLTHICRLDNGYLHTLCNFIGSGLHLLCYAHTQSTPKSRSIGFQRAMGFS